MRMERKDSQSFLTKIVLFILSVVAMSYLFCRGNFFDAIAILSMIMFHELGHIMAAKSVGIGSRGIYILPLIGGVAVLNEMPLNRGKEAFISLAGPFFGLIFSLVFLLLSYPLQAANMTALAGIMAAINLLNIMIPSNPLDGGRIFKSIAFSIGRTVGLLALLLGLGISLYILLAWHMYVMILIAFLGMLDFSEEYKNLTDKTRMGVGGILLSITASIAIMFGLFLILDAGVASMRLVGYFK